MRERDIEKALCDRVKQLGGLCEKFVSPNRRNVPDRIVTLHDGEIIFVELKATGEGPTKAQERDHTKRKYLGCDVRVINTIEAAYAFPN